MAKGRRNRTEGELVAMLARKYPAPAYALIAQVRDSTGASACRTADALAFSLWPSRGLGIEDFECKSSRSDWLKELSDPTKAGEFQRFCRRWWIVCGSDDLVHPGELPPTWGLMVPTPNGQGLRVVAEAPLLDASAPDLPLLCAIMRRMTDATISREEHQDIVERVRVEAEERGKQAATKAPERGFEQAFRELREKVDQFKNATGVDLDWRHDSTRYHEAMKLLVHDNYRQDVKRALAEAAEEFERQAAKHRKRVVEISEAERLLEASRG